MEPSHRLHVSFSRARRNISTRRLTGATLLATLASGLVFVPTGVSPGRASGASATSFSFAAAGDFGANANTGATLNALAGAGTDFFLAGGDLSYDQVTPESAWCDFVTSRVGSTYPFELLSGNHEDDGPNGVITNFAACLPDRLGGITGSYAKQYFFDYPPSGPLARFILISPNLTFAGEGTYSYGLGSPRYGWLSNTIDEARASGIPWVIVAMHKNCITAGVKPCEIGADLMNLLVSKRVDLVLQGHEHSYQRSTQLGIGPYCPAIPIGSFDADCIVDDGADSAYLKGAGPVIVIDGTGGMPLEVINTGDAEAPYFAVFMDRVMTPSFGFVRYQVSSTELHAQFIASGPGTFSDAFTIAGSVPPPPPPPPVEGIVFHGAASNGSMSGRNTVTIARPAGTVAGDVMVASIVVNDDDPLPGAPAGWALIRQDAIPNVLLQALYRRVAGPAEPTAYTWALSAYRRVVGGISAYAGVDPAVPIDAHGASVNGTAGTAITAASVTTTVAGAMVLHHAALNAEATISPPAGLAERWENSSSNLTSTRDATAESSDAVQVAAGPTGTLTATGSTAGMSIGAAIALRPLAFLPPPPPSSGIAFRGAASSGSSSPRNSVTISRPAGTVAGDVMVASIVVNDDDPIPIAPAGWTLIRQDAVTNALLQAVYQRVAGPAEPGSYTWVLSISRRVVAGISAYSGVDPGSPVEAHGSVTNTSGANAITAPSLSTSVPGAMVVQLAAINAEATISPPIGMSERWENTSPHLTSSRDATAASSDAVHAEAGSTGSRTAMASSAGKSIATLIALRPLP